MPQPEDNGSSLQGAAIRPMLRRGRSFWAPVVGLGVLVVLGLVAWALQVRRGLGVAGYDDRTFWSIYEADLVAFIGVSYGGALVSAILRLTGARWRAPITRLAEATALFSLVVGMLFAVIHLGRPERIWELIVYGRLASPIVWDLIAVCTYLAATLLFLYLPLIPDLAAVPRLLGWSPEGRRARLYAFLARGWRGNPAQRRLLARSIGLTALLIIPLAVSVHSVLGWSFALTSRPGWHSTIFAPYFVVAAVYSGVGLVIVVAAWLRRAYGLHGFLREEHFVRLGYILVTLDAAYLYFTFSDLLTEGYPMDSASVSLIDQLLVGRYAMSFWLFVAAGGILPLLLVAARRTRRIPGIVTAAGLAVGGMWLKRMLIVVPATSQPLIGGPWGSYHLTWVSGAITIGAAAAIPLLLLLFFRLVPVLDLNGMEELRAETPAGREVPAPLDQRGVVSPRARSLSFALAGLVALATVAAPASAVAAQRHQPVAAAPVTLTLSTSADRAQPEVVLLSATLRAGQQPLGHSTVQFFVHATTFGDALVPIGSATTDATGIAVLRYRPTWTGPHRFVARPTRGGVPLTHAQASFTVTRTSGADRSPPEPLPGVRYWLVRSLLAAVALVWVLLTFVLLRAVLALPRLAAASDPTTGASTRAV